MGQCTTLDADVTIGCYYGDYSSCGQHHSYVPFIFWNNFFTDTCVKKNMSKNSSAVWRVMLKLLWNLRNFEMVLSHKVG